MKDTEDVEINAARTFLEIVKTGSFVNAASNLHITQTAVSARIRVLEEQLNRPLFIRNKAGAQLTREGHQFLRFATTLVQVWDRARQSVALPQGRELVVTVGAEISVWSPLLRHWLLWMKQECPEIAANVQIDSAERLMKRVQDGSLDLAILYAAQQRPGIITELLIEEKLVLVRTTGTDRVLGPDDHVHIDWGEEFVASYRAAFPEASNAIVSISYGPLALDYILAVGGSGYFRMSVARPFLEQGRLELVPNSPEFSYSAYAVHSTKVDEGVMARIRSGLRAAAIMSI